MRRKKKKKNNSKSDKLFGGKKLPRDALDGRVEVLLAQSCGNRFHPTETPKPCRPRAGGLSHCPAMSDPVVRVAVII